VNHKRVLFIAAAAAALCSIVLIGASMTSTAFVPVIPGKVGVVLQAQLIASEPWNWTMPFAMASLAFLALIPVIVGIEAMLAGNAFFARLILVTGVPGALLCSISSFMHATVSRRAAAMMVSFDLPNYEARSKAAYLALSTEWSMINTFSAAYAFSVFGQTLSSVMLLVLGVAWARDNGLKKVTAALSLLAAACQFAGFAGHLFFIDVLAPGLAAYYIILPFELVFLMIIFIRSAKSSAALEE